jgi:hypothetical protein
MCTWQHPLLSPRHKLPPRNTKSEKIDSSVRPGCILPETLHHALLPAIQAPVAARRQAVAIFDQLFPSVGELKSIADRLCYSQSMLYNFQLSDSHNIVGAASAPRVSAGMGIQSSRRWFFGRYDVFKRSPPANPCLVGPFRTFMYFLTRTKMIHLFSPFSLEVSLPRGDFKT